MSEVVVIGAGAWGTALAIQAARAGRSVTLWARDPGRAATMARVRENPRLPSIVLPAGVAVVSGTPPEAELVLLAVPLPHLRTVAGTLSGRGAMVCCAKGVEAGTLALPLEILAGLHPGRPACVLTGPNFAGEVARGQPTAAVVAATEASVREAVIDALATPGFRLYGQADPVGAQVGGAAKNVVAIAAGVVIGAGLGENARAALITRGVAEIGRLSVALGGAASTVAGLAGLGDLLLTATSPASRNTSLGMALGAGRSLADVMAQRTAATEGVSTAPALLARAAAAGVAMPVCAAVTGLVTGRLAVAAAMAELLSRPLRDE